MDINMNVCLGRAVALALSVVRLVVSLVHSVRLVKSRRTRVVVCDTQTTELKQGDTGQGAALEGATAIEEGNAAVVCIPPAPHDQAATSISTPQLVAASGEFAQREAEPIAETPEPSPAWPTTEEGNGEQQLKLAAIQGDRCYQPESTHLPETFEPTNHETTREECEEPEAAKPLPNPEAQPNRPDEGQATEVGTDELSETRGAGESVRAKRRPARPEARAAMRPAPGGAPDDRRRAPRAVPRGATMVRPQLVCWREAQTWKLGVVAPGEEDYAEVSLDGRPLQADPLAVWSEGPVWVLDLLTGTVSARPGDEGAGHRGELVLPKQPYLVFRLRASDQDRGIHIQRPGSPGQYLVVVPTTWRPKEDTTTARRLLAAPERVSVPGYYAYRFVIEQLPAVVDFKSDQGTIAVIKARKTGFCLVGLRLQDRVGGWGPLFGCDPPGVKALAVPWESVAFMVVGEEGRGAAEWRERRDVEQLARDDVIALELNADAGWYFVRFYDKGEVLLDSLDFRFVRGLKEIRAASGTYPLPGDGGYSDACVELVYGDGEVEVRPAADPVANGVSFETVQGRAVIRVPPDPRADWSEWQVGPLDRRVTLPLLLERVWWMLGSESAPPSPDSDRWADKPLFVRPEDARASSNSVIWLRMPRPGWVRRVRVGFSRSKARLFPVCVDAQVCSVPLREFASASELQAGTKQLALRLWLDKNLPSGEPAGAVIAILTPQASLYRSTGISRGQGIGRKRRALAVATMREGSGAIRVNGRPLEDFLVGSRPGATAFLLRLLEVDDVQRRLMKLDISIEVQGARLSVACQCRAIAHAVARAVAVGDRALASSLRRRGFGGVRVRVRDLPLWAKELIQGDSG